MKYKNLIKKVAAKDRRTNTTDRHRTPPKYCPKCSGFGYIFDSRNQNGYVWRRHLCKRKHAWSSIEVMAEGGKDHGSSFQAALQAMRRDAIRGVIATLEKEIA